MSWTAYLIHAVSGRIGPKVEISSLNWGVDLNDDDSMKISLKKSSLPGMDSYHWLRPWWGGVLILWNNQPIVAGVIVSHPSEFKETVSIDCRGVRALLSRRLATREQGDWDYLTEDSVTFEDMSLSAISREVVKLGLNKTGGMLPIHFGPSEDNEQLLDNARIQGSAGQRLVLPVHYPSPMNQTVHPSVLFFEEGWNGYRYWMSHTPYPYGDDNHEDPNIAASNDGTNWVVPRGLTNPIDDAGGEPEYNSDSVITMGPNNDMYLMWRLYDESAAGRQEQLWFSKSSDGVTWSPKQLVWQNDQNVRRTLSPALVWEGNQWHMWYVDMTKTPFALHYTKASKLEPAAWGTPVRCSVGPIGDGKQPWHVSVRREGDRWVGLLNTTNLIPVEQTGQGELHLMYSYNGTSFETSSKESVIPRESRNEHEGLYAASMVKVDEDVYDVWYSAIALNPAGYIWGIFRSQIKANNSFTPISGDHERTYRGYDVANLKIDDVLTKLSEVTNGPDIMFRPRLLNSSRFVWDMYTGNELDPRIPQRITPIWDTTAVNTEVTELQMVMTGNYQTNRVYSVGAGQDEGIILEVAEDLSSLEDGYPLLENPIKTGDSEDPRVVMAWGVGHLEANLEPLLEITCQVRADGQYALGQYWPGAVVELVVKDWLNLPDGRHKARLLAMSGTDTNTLRLSLQTE